MSEDVYDCEVVSLTIRHVDAAVGRSRTRASLMIHFRRLMRGRRGGWCFGAGLP